MSKIGCGSLTVVGTGMRAVAQLTLEARGAIEECDRLFHVVQDGLSRRFLDEARPGAESLADAYARGKSRHASYAEMVERVLAPVRAGERVCLALYGHPGVFATAGHEAVRRARAEGYPATMLPGVSAADCLYADLGVDPGSRGCQSFEATDFLVRHRRFDPTCHLLLWQVGALGVEDFRPGDGWNPGALAVLGRELAATYGADHAGVIYEAPAYPIGEARRERVRLNALAGAAVTLATTLYVPPLPERELDAARLAELRATIPGDA